MKYNHILFQMCKPENIYLFQIICRKKERDEEDTKLDCRANT